MILNRFDNYSFLDFHPNHLNDIRSREMQGRIETSSLNRKRLRYWRDTIIDDSAISWSWNLTVLKKKIEYNIGYWKYVQRHVGWREDVRRMELCCRLLEIASEVTGEDHSAPTQTDTDIEQEANAVASEVRDQVILEKKVGVESSALLSDTGGTAGKKMA